jgi:hypothetical protein
VYQSFTFAASFVAAVSMTSKVGSVIPRDSNPFWLRRRFGDANSFGWPSSEPGFIGWLI